MLPPANKAPKVAVTKAKVPSPASYAAVAKNTSSTGDLARVNPKRMRKKSEALILKKTGEASYADMLRKMRADPNLSELGKHVEKIRTQQGDLLLEVDGKPPETYPYTEEP